MSEKTKTIKIKKPRKSKPAEEAPKPALLDILSKKTGMSESTKKVYTNLIKRLIKFDFKFNYDKKEDVDYIVDWFKSNGIETLSARLDLINIIIVLRTLENLPSDELKSLRKTLSLERIDKNVDVMKAAGKELMSVEAFDEELKGLFLTKQYKAYVVNYLLRHYGVRNEDLNVEIVFKQKGWKPDPTKNYLVRTSTTVNFIRNNYKTVKTYGPKQDKIKAARFVQAVGEIGSEFGLRYNDPSAPESHRLLSGGQVSNELRKLIIGKMTESQVFKMLIDDAYKRGDTAEINRLSISRGTNVETINDFYNTNAEHKIIREI
jgi:hypothetical protein